MQKLNDAFDNLYMVAYVGSVLVLLASIALSNMIFILGSEIKENVSKWRVYIISGVLILLVGLSGCGLLIYLGTVFK